MISIVRYSAEKKEEWNQFNLSSKNHLFMFDRDYMDYHKDRFVDHSLMFYDEDNLVALLPMTERDSEFISHGGLTYGGFITSNKMKQHTMNDCLDELVDYAKKHNILRIHYKVIPHFYHNQPAEEDRYSLFLHDANIEKIEASTVVNLKNPLKMPKGRKAQISRAKREGVEIRELTNTEDFFSFIDLENSVLQEYHETKAVHSGSEINLLHDRFPNSIHLFGAIKDEKLIAGTIVFEYDNVVHTQYMAANEEARTLGALDLAISAVVEKYSDKKDWLDFGISTEDGGRTLNLGLISQKEGFGGRTVTYNTFVLDI
ncbi:GNAT family N-acetyltransferase [Pseudobutyrivibrio xylanivorans]|uniref:Acetyltransferase (GNAT) domain-containing protein n=1 Tax=Pseudobutyrivibrio xylanivorans DSM 14809 TaxID=1123012 RepID=A0A1M6KNI7_PSEXY|nr:GNAT family N-acetyltransferase [Pseudobutyrivibrio xylanivorans]SHJ60509.1 Acetyltransferase (GNAT) domain-containing protein [Pseudobutyrivibrio xylanivorans DSM 14809]